MQGEFTWHCYIHFRAFIREKNNHIYTLLGKRAVSFWLDSVGLISFN